MHKLESIQYNHTENGSNFRLDALDGKITKVEVWYDDAECYLDITDQLPEATKSYWEALIALAQDGGVHQSIPVEAPDAKKVLVNSEAHIQLVLAKLDSKGGI